MRARLLSAAAALALALFGGVLLAQPQSTTVAERREKVGLGLRVSPVVSFSPSRVFAVAELKGDLQPDQEALLYCASMEWDWGDGTRSESSHDCEPYEAGKSELKRRFAAEHTFQYSGRYRVQFRLKRNDRVLLTSNSNVQVRPGAREVGP